MRILLDDNPLAPSNKPPSDFEASYKARPAWIAARQDAQPPEVSAYRLQFSLPQAAVMRIHVSADERYRLYLDGQDIGCGPERGSERAWFYETYELDLAAGAHTLVAVVWRLGEIGPLAQVSLQGGFLLEAEGPMGSLVSTKSAPWEVKSLQGIGFNLPDIARRGAWFVEPNQTTNGAVYPWGIELGQGEGWEAVYARREDFGLPFGIQARHILQPAPLPAQMAKLRSAGRVRHVSGRAWEDAESIVVVKGDHLPDEVGNWQAMLDGSKAVVIPAHTQRQVVLDLEQYVCAYPQLRVSGGKNSRLSVGWAEALHLDRSGKAKGQRDAVEGKTFMALCRDEFLPDGGMGRQFEPLWWRAGCFLQVLVETGEQPLTIEGLRLLETRYPLEMESRFKSSDSRLEAVIPVALRGLQMCAHETYMDCPYYEQMMYVGDTRLEALTTYAISSDERLTRKAIKLFELSRLPEGFTQARYPGRDQQLIPPFALWWIGMVYDYALWRGDRAFIGEMLPGVRAVLDGFLTYIGDGNLVQSPPAGWNFYDWVADWPSGVPPSGFDGFSGLLNWHLVNTFGQAAQLEEWAGEPWCAQRWQEWRDTVAAACKASFWDEKQGLFADDLSLAHFSEHTQCLALLSGALAGEQYDRTAQNLLSSTALTQTTIYFTHYLFETYRLLGQPEAFFSRMGLWFDLPVQGFKTTPEQPEPSRSDCHGWGAHPLYHYFASLLGIRPGSFGFETVEMAPMPGHLTQLSGEMVHPQGRIDVNLHFDKGGVRGNVALPTGLSGTLRYCGKTVVLKPGQQTIEL
jgi:hypothetical protein